jgi:hypothetical protein
MDDVTLYYANCGGTPFSRSGPYHAAIFPYGPFSTNDGKTVIGIQNEREWKVLCEGVLHRPELVGDARFDSNSQRVANLYHIVVFVILLAQRNPFVWDPVSLFGTRMLTGIGFSAMTVIGIYLHRQSKSPQRAGWRRFVNARRKQSPSRLGQC